MTQCEDVDVILQMSVLNKRKILQSWESKRQDLQHVAERLREMHSSASHMLQRLERFRSACVRVTMLRKQRRSQQRHKSASVTEAPMLLSVSPPRHLTTCNPTLLEEPTVDEASPPAVPHTEKRGVKYYAQQREELRLYFGGRVVQDAVATATTSATSRKEVGVVASSASTAAQEPHDSAPATVTESTRGPSSHYGGAALLGAVASMAASQIQRLASHSHAQQSGPTSRSGGKKEPIRSRLDILSELSQCVPSALSALQQSMPSLLQSLSWEPTRCPLSGVRVQFACETTVDGIADVAPPLTWTDGILSMDTRGFCFRLSATPAINYFVFVGCWWGEVENDVTALLRPLKIIGDSKVLYVSFEDPAHFGTFVSAVREAQRTIASRWSQSHDLASCIA